MRERSFFYRYKLHHVLFWMLVYGLWYFLRYNSFYRAAFEITLVKVIDLAIMVYFTNYVLIPKLLYKKRYGWFALAFIAMIVTSSFIKMQIIGQIMNNPGCSICRIRPN
ncbi:MAG: hypothetical protein WDO16_19435 [Bacteroidota bacterium]